MRWRLPTRLLLAVVAVVEAEEARSHTTLQVEVEVLAPTESRPPLQPSASATLSCLQAAAPVAHRDSAACPTTTTAAVPEMEEEVAAAFQASRQCPLHLLLLPPVAEEEEEA